MAEEMKAKTQESPAFEYVCKRLAYAFNYRSSQEFTKFRDYWRGE
jgi:hypothetical protein